MKLTALHFALQAAEHNCRILSVGIRRVVLTLALAAAASGVPAHAEGTVVCWGYNGNGQCTVPGGLSGVVQLAAGYYHTTALTSDGSVVCWGRDDEDQCTVPDGLTGVVQLSAGYYHTTALKSDGSVVCWGRDDEDQCTVPDGLTGVVQLSAGGRHTTALKSDGSVVCWGDNSNGQCTVPRGLSGVVQLSAGQVHTTALKSDGSVVCWGREDEGQCTVPDGLTGVVQLSAGRYHTTALKSDGSVVCWGDNNSGQCNVPSGLSGVVQLAAGGYRTTALTSDGSVVCWGYNLVGQCTVPDGLTGVVQLSEGSGHTAALVCDGVVEARASGELAPFSFGVNPVWTATDIDPSSTGATLTITARGNLGTSTRFLTVRIDDQVLAANIFGSGSGAGNCTVDPSVAVLPISAAQFAALTTDRQLVVKITPSSNATSAGCANATLTARLDWQRDLIDCNGNNVDDECDIGINPATRDCDENGVLDSCQIAGGAPDINGNGRLDVCEVDCNGNGWPDSWEISTGLVPDCNTNERPDSCDVAAGGGSADVDQNGVPDECKADCNNNDLPDAYEIAIGLVPDCNGNGVPDSCEIAANPSFDCNGNGVLDSCEIAANPSLDCNQNGWLDTCEIPDNPGLDCDGNNTLDSCDIAANPQRDCNGNNVLDACDVMAGAEDENVNGVPDSCEVAAGDLDLDGTISGGDLAAFLGVWGVSGAPYGDLNQDGLLDGADLALLLSKWGQSPWQRPPSPPWATVLAQYPTVAVVPSADLRRRIAGTNLPWRVKDTATQIEFVLIPPGTFNMGCSASQSWGCYSHENPVHQVTLTNAFYLGRYEVTQAQWTARMGSNPSSFQSASAEVPQAQVPQRPVEKVSWNTIQGFLSQTGMRLPTEAEWEYAYRAGTTTAFHGHTGQLSGTNNDSLLGSIAWFSSNANSQTRPVGGKLGNGFGLHDMAGNVWEWVNDWYGPYSVGAQTNPQGPSSGTDRVLRGGSWGGGSNYCRASYRKFNGPAYSNYDGGFRVARTPYEVATLTAVSPASGPPGGGTAITLTGTYLAGATSVTVGGAPCTNVQVVNNTTVTAVTPAGSSGTQDIVLTCNKGSVTLSGGFTYAVVPAWATLIENNPDPSVVTDANLRAAITATGLPWRVRDTATQIEFVLIPPGTFNMGCSASQQYGCWSEENPVHQVTLTNAFYLGRYEVTQAQWQASMGYNPSLYQSASAEVPQAQVPQRPVELVSWNTIQGFLSQTGMRLPTEAEWEYAYRAGTTTAFHGYTGQLSGTNDDNLLGNIAWFSGNANSQTRPVGGKLCNGFGLHDMAGNVSEWVNDWYGNNYYSTSPSVNPQGPSSGSFRVLRGGVWGDGSGLCRASVRVSLDPGYEYIGFRVARTP